jgi:hypothetical protein
LSHALNNETIPQRTVPHSSELPALGGLAQSFSSFPSRRREFGDMDNDTAKFTTMVPVLQLLCLLLLLLLMMMMMDLLHLNSPNATSWHHPSKDTHQTGKKIWELLVVGYWYHPHGHPGTKTTSHPHQINQAENRCLFGLFLPGSTDTLWASL